MDMEDLDDLEEEEGIERQDSAIVPIASVNKDELLDVGTSHQPTSTEGDGDKPQHKDSSGRRIRALQSVLKMVLKLPKSGQVTPQDVQDAAFKGTKFEQHECIVVANLANTLRPYVSKRRPKPQDAFPGGSTTIASLPHVLLRAPLVHWPTPSVVCRDTPSLRVRSLLSPPLPHYKVFR